MRYDLEFAPSLVGSDSEMVARADGDWVLYVSHLAEVRQTQRQMIAALYWRAGDLFDRADETGVREFSPPPPDGYPLARVLRDEGCGVLFAARAMEAACAR